MERENITYTIIGCAMKVHNTLGNGFQEIIYQRCLAIELTEAKLNFEREEMEDGSVKYKKGAFRILIPIKDDFSKFDIWYREEKRHIMQPISVHQLQNHHLEMTKIHLTRETFN